MSNNIPQISIFGSAYRPHYWMDLYNSIGNNDVTFEIIFVGPNEPDYKLPDNFRFIKSLVKPTQCIEIAARNTRADLIMNIPDDVVFRTKRPLDKLYETYKSYNNDKLILSCRYMYCGRHTFDSWHAYRPLRNNKSIIQDIHTLTVFPNIKPRITKSILTKTNNTILASVHNKEPLIMPLSGLMSKKLYRDIGGIDKNFIATYWDLDMAMRIYTIGGCVKLGDVYLDEVFGAGGSHNVYLDKPYLDSLWTTKGRIHFNRAKYVEPFSDDKILEESQGPKGKWV